MKSRTQEHCCVLKGRVKGETHKSAHMERANTDVCSAVGWLMGSFNLDCLALAGMRLWGWEGGGADVHPCGDGRRPAAPVMGKRPSVFQQNLLNELTTSISFLCLPAITATHRTTGSKTAEGLYIKEAHSTAGMPVLAKQNQCNSLLTVHKSPR